MNHHAEKNRSSLTATAVAFKTDLKFLSMKKPFPAFAGDVAGSKPLRRTNQNRDRKLLHVSGREDPVGISEILLMEISPLEYRKQILFMRISCILLHLPNMALRTVRVGLQLGCLVNRLTTCPQWLQFHPHFLPFVF